MSTPPREPTEEEIRAAYEAELKRLRVEDVLLQTVVSLINLAGRKAGLAPGTEDERDLDQLRMAIDAAQIRDALSQLQMAYAQSAGTGAGGGERGEQPPAEGGRQDRPGGTGPAQSSGRLWVPGQ